MKFNSFPWKGIMAAACCLVTLISFSQTTPERVNDYLKSYVNNSTSDQANEVGFTITGLVPHHRLPFKHLYVRQTFKGLPISNASAVLVEKSDGEISITGNRLVSEVTAPTGSEILLNEQLILEKLLAVIGETNRLSDYVLEKKNPNEFVFVHPNTAFNVPFKASYFFDDGQMKRAWECNIETSDHLHAWSMVVDATNAEILRKGDRVVSCSFESCSGSGSFHHEHLEAKNQTKSWMMAPPVPPQNDTYRVFPYPVESPIHGSDALVVGPYDTQFSPFGWHDTDGVAGEEYTITRGNNVFAYDDKDDDDLPGFSPDGGTDLVFDYPITSTLDPNDYLDASITNLFYSNNMIHDILSYYGFDEASGNFQEMNYSGAGVGGDGVLAEAQDGSGANNANFRTEPEGTNPRMQMYLWDPDGGARMLFVDAPASIAGAYGSNHAQFGPPVPTGTPLSAELAYGADSSGNDPIDGCSQIVTDLTGKIAYVRNGGCSPAIKVKNCQDAGALGVVVGHNGLGAPGPMTGNPPDPITIPSLIVDLNSSGKLNNTLQAGETVNVTMFDDGWSGVTDSDLDNLIISHEYGHGVSNRLTGGASDVFCLFNQDQMGEGWSDFIGLVLTMEPGDEAEDRRGVGAYVENQPTDGDGIRPTVYSTDFLINPSTYGGTNSLGLSMPHGIGYVWATMLWEMTWALIDEYGFDDDIKAGTGGNNIAMELVIEGMKLQPCSPGFVDGRDAILQADELLNNGDNYCLIWRAFGKRGLGVNAEQGSTNDRTDQVQDFSLPQVCTLGLTDEEQMSFVRMFPNPSLGEFEIQTLESNKIQLVRIVDMNGRVVFESADLNNQTFKGTIEGFNSGVYLVDIQLEKGKIMRRLTKQ